MSVAPREAIANCAARYEARRARVPANKNGGRIDAGEKRGTSHTASSPAFVPSPQTIRLQVETMAHFLGSRHGTTLPRVTPCSWVFPLLLFFPFDFLLEDPPRGFRSFAHGLRRNFRGPALEESWLGNAHSQTGLRWMAPGLTDYLNALFKHRVYSICPLLHHSQEELGPFDRSPPRRESCAPLRSRFLNSRLSAN